MADVKSYAWSHQLAEAVAPGGTVEVPTPGFENPDNYDTTKTEVVCGANVLRSDQVGVSWAGDFVKVTLTNNDQALTWEVASTVSVAVPGIPFDTENVEESFTALTAQVADHETRIKALEGAAKTPASQPAPAHRPAPTPARPPGGAPQHRGSGTKP